MLAEPNAGTRWVSPKGRVMLRLYMEGTQNHLYYTHDSDKQLIRIWCLWGCSSGPRTEALGRWEHLRQPWFRRGDLDAIVEVYPSDGLEVEFVRASGQTQALVKLTTSDVRPIQDLDLIAVRTLAQAG